MLRVVADGETSSELEVLQFLSTPEMRSHPGNHTLPMLQVLYFEKWKFKFAVFPMSGGYPCSPWFRHLDEVLDCIGQTLEGLTFLHENLIAHRDIAEENILINHMKCRTQPGSGSPPFRSLFPVRYLFIDFEYAVRFPKDSDPSTRLVSPIEGIERFGAPETKNDTDYCPFAADVFNLGFFYFLKFRVRRCGVARKLTNLMII
ncbi:hypothetical protein BD410DRAFT_771580 [Rickenella mellea]|uniref:Protein kinase domain-containing protein n=1 Tax=Rickenella mellea TaxID=50990 RepID=A0A4Y7Q278_9AGAM|nr:hypothetical protein BD410DRAFT_771580 [Rickenella mellea]